MLMCDGSMIVYDVMLLRAMGCPGMALLDETYILLGEPFRPGMTLDRFRRWCYLAHGFLFESVIDIGCI
jgi:hypothetical protein